MLFGIYSYYIMPKQEAPDLNVTVAMITTIYPGAAPQDVEKLVTQKIEDRCIEISGYDYSQSYSNRNMSIVIVRLENDADTDKAWSQLRQKMKDLQSELPEECQDIEVNTDLAETAGMIISLSGDMYSYEELASYAEEFKKALSRIDGVSRMDIVGDQKYQVTVDVDAQKLNSYRLSMGDIVSIIQSQNIEIPSGAIDDGTTKINVSTRGSYESIREIENTIVDVSEGNGSIVRLKDIASIGMTLEDSNYKIRYNNKNAVLLTGYFKANRNVVLIGDIVEQEIRRLKAQLPPDVEIEKVLFQPENIRKSVNNFIINLLEGVLFVILVVFIGMGLRNAVIVSTAIPLSILATFGTMNLLGIKLHQISIAALIIALGMLVDNAIVISDAIQVRIDRDEEKISACVQGVKEVAIPVLTSTLTTIAAFIPLLMLPSMAGEYVSSLPQIISISLFASYITALFVTPSMAFILFKKSKAVERKSRTRKAFSFLILLGMKRKAVVIMFAVLAGVLTAYTAMNLGLQFFPKADTNIIYIDLKTERNADISKTEELVRQVSEILDKQAEVSSYTAAIGNGLPKFYNTLPVSMVSQDTAQIMISLDLDKGTRFKSNEEMVAYLQERFDSTITAGTVTAKQLEIGEPIGSPVIVRVTGEDMEDLGKIAREIRDSLKEIPGTMNVDDDYTDKIYEFGVNVDIDRASFMGISKYDAQKEVSLALQGTKASVYRYNGKEYNIEVKSNIKSKEELENFAIKSSYTSNKVLLKDLADIALSPQIPTIKKYDRDFSVTVYSDIKPGYNSVSIQDQLAQKLDKMDLGSARIVFDGEKEKISEHFGNVGSSAIFALLLIYGILLLQFRSFVQPVIVLVTIPMSSFGSVIGLHLSGQPLSFMGLLGIVSLMGIVVNNAIILIDYINNSRKEGKTIHEACLEASAKRFRPIMLTTTTTVIGLIPLVFSKSSLFTPMAAALISGLIVSTLLTLVVIPVVYSLFEIKLNNKQTIKANGKSQHV